MILAKTLKFLFNCAVFIGITVVNCHETFISYKTVRKPVYSIPKHPNHGFPFSQFPKPSATPIQQENRRQATDLSFLHAYTAENLSPVKHTNPGGIFSLLLNGSENDLDLALSQNAVLDTMADVLSIIGLKDLRDWLGIILMMFLLGPVLIPIVMLPAPTLALGALLFPIILHTPPSALNDNIAGHDPRIGTGERAMPSDTLNNASMHYDFSSSKCMEMLSCEFRGLVGKWTSQDPVSRIPKYEEDCSDHYCSILYPMQSFLRSYYFYIFGDGTKLYNDR